jgi:hypothetical protein
MYRAACSRTVWILDLGSALFTYAIMGAARVGLGTLRFDLDAIPPTAWRIAVSPGLYLGHVPHGCVLFDRTIAALGVSAASISAMRAVHVMVALRG